MVLVIFREKSLVGQCMVWHPKDHWTLKTGHFEDPNPAIQVQTLPLKGPRSVGQLIFCWPPKKAHTIQRSKQRRYIRLEVEAGCIHPGRVGSLESRSIYSAISVRIKSKVLVSLVGCITTYSLAVPYDIPCITTYSLYRTHSLFQKGSACKSQELMPHV